MNQGILSFIARYDNVPIMTDHLIRSGSLTKLLYNCILNYFWNNKWWISQVSISSIVDKQIQHSFMEIVLKILPLLCWSIKILSQIPFYIKRPPTTLPTQCDVSYHHEIAWKRYASQSLRKLIGRVH